MNNEKCQRIGVMARFAFSISRCSFFIPFSVEA